MKDPNYKYVNVDKILKDATKLIKYIEEFELSRVTYEATLGYVQFDVSINNSYHNYYRISISERNCSIVDEYEYDINTGILKFSNTYMY